MTPFKTSKVFQQNWTSKPGIDLIVNRGGTSSGKTYSILQVLFLKAWENPGCVITVVGQDIPNLKKGAIRDAATIVNSSDWLASQIKYYNKSDRFYQFYNGSVIEFNSYDDEQDAKNGKRDFSFFNEVNGIPYEVFEAIYVRTRLTTWVDFNPSSTFWLTDKKIEQRATVKTIKSTFKHNPFLDEKTVSKILSYEPTQENIKQGTANEYRWKVYGLGEYAALEGAIFKRWKKGAFNEELPYIWCIDWGTKDPFVLLKFAINREKRKIYLQERCYEPAGERGSEWMKKIIERNCGKDDLIIADSAEPITISTLRNEGFNIQPCFKKPGIVVQRLKWMMDYFMIVDGSNIENELNNYKWADKRGEVPIDDYNHAIDAAGYGMTYYKLNVFR